MRDPKVSRDVTSSRVTSRTSPVTRDPSRLARNRKSVRESRVYPNAQNTAGRGTGQFATRNGRQHPRQESTAVSSYSDSTMPLMSRPNHAGLRQPPETVPATMPNIVKPRVRFWEVSRVNAMEKMVMTMDTMQRLRQGRGARGRPTGHYECKRVTSLRPRHTGCGATVGTHASWLQKATHLRDKNAVGLSGCVALAGLCGRAADGGDPWLTLAGEATRRRGADSSSPPLPDGSCLRRWNQGAAVARRGGVGRRTTRFGLRTNRRAMSGGGRTRSFRVHTHIRLAPRGPGSASPRAEQPPTVLHQRRGSARRPRHARRHRVTTRFLRDTRCHTRAHRWQGGAESEHRAVMRVRRWEGRDRSYRGNEDPRGVSAQWSCLIAVFRMQGATLRSSGRELFLTASARPSSMAKSRRYSRHFHAWEPDSAFAGAFDLVSLFERTRGLLRFVGLPSGRNYEHWRNSWAA